MIFGGNGDMSETKIAEHRRMVVMTGNLSDFHMENLRAWPYIIFEKENLDSVDIDYNFTKQVNDGEALDAGKIVYNFNFKGVPCHSGEELKVRMDHLRAWVKGIFWTDTVVVFKKNGEEWEI